MIETTTGKSAQFAQNSQQPLRNIRANYFSKRRTKNNFLLIGYGQSPEGGSVQQTFICHAERRTTDKC